ncbi:hypothetical protein [uncultured Jatrophihabitans sp.]|uniref:hypothetical protein n=1 Tax=uncultured Jatrophihabitans sp. TaxID=1610747 RepID=UPI0035C9EA57
MRKHIEFQVVGTVGLDPQPQAEVTGRLGGLGEGGAESDPAGRPTPTPDRVLDARLGGRRVGDSVPSAKLATT